MDLTPVSARSLYRLLWALIIHNGKTCISWRNKIIWIKLIYRHDHDNRWLWQKNHRYVYVPAALFNELKSIEREQLLWTHWFPWNTRTNNRWYKAAVGLDRFAFSSVKVDINGGNIPSIECDCAREAYKCSHAAAVVIQGYPNQKLINRLVLLSN